MATYYAVCGAQNQLSTDSRGNPLSLVTDNSPHPQILNTDSAYECCAACLRTPNCAGSNYVPSLTDQGANCELAVYDVCLGQYQVADKLTTNGNNTGTFSNGFCGHYALS
jgi:hypothetical protein